MTALVLSLILSILCLVVILSAASPWPPERTDERRAQEPRLADALSLSAIFYSRVEALFDRAEFDYLLSIGAHAAAKEFYRDRKGTALLWLRQLRADVHRLLALHRRLAQVGVESSLRAKLYLLSNAAIFYVVHSFLYLSVSAFGPYALTRVWALMRTKTKSVFRVLERVSVQASPSALEAIFAEQRRKYLVGES